MIIGNNFIYIRIPRTGSSSIEEALKSCHIDSYNSKYTFYHMPPGADIRKCHYTAQLAIDSMGSDYGNKVSYAFVRNPYDRIVSYYYLYSRKLHGFREFVISYIKNKDRISAFPFWYTQHKWTHDCNGNKIVSTILRFEKLEEDFNLMCDSVGIERKKLKHIKKSIGKRDYREYYTNETKKIVYEACEKDFELFEYGREI